MNKLLLTTALVALVGLSACDNKKDDADNVAPAAGEVSSTATPAGEQSLMVAPDTTTSTTTTTTTTDTVPAEPVVTPEGATSSTTTTTTTEGVAVGEPTPATAAPTDACGSHTDLIGKNIKDVDQTNLAKTVRVIHPGDAVTMDYSPDRLNITVDKDSEKVLSVHCG